MNSRRKDKRIRAQKKSQLISSRALRLFILFFFFIQYIQSQTTIQQYDLNDPRNPDCPCHQYQQLADEEYRKVRKASKAKESKLEALNNVSIRQSIQTKKTESAISRADSYKKSKNKKGIWFHKKTNRSYFNHHKIKKLKPDYSVCYQW